MAGTEPRNWARRSALSLALLSAFPAYADGVLITGTGLVPDRSASAVTLSGNGRVAVLDTQLGNDPSTLQYYLWTPAGATPMLYPGQTQSVISALNFNGDVAVGFIDDATSTPVAFRLVQGTVQILGSLGAFSPTNHFAMALGVSADGNVVVGQSTSPQYAAEAFRWTPQSGMVGLGALNGGTGSIANGVSGDGRVVIGVAHDGSLPGTVGRAFRWTQESGLVSLGAPAGLAASVATAASWDGSVIAGNAGTASMNFAAVADSRAFRWTQAGGFTLLDLPAGWMTSAAGGISADGSVIVGTLTGASPAATQGFRWSTSAGTQTIEQWLQANGVSIGSLVTRTAVAVSYDGNTVLGNLANNDAYIARIGAFPGLITLDDLRTSLGSNAPAPAQVANVGDVVINGAHSRPLARRAQPGKSCAWVAGDLGRDDHAERDGSFTVGEVGACHRFGDGMQVGLSLGTSRNKQELPLGGRSEVDTVFGVAEALGQIGATNLWWSGSLLYMMGEADARRVYSVNGGDTATSSGRPDVDGVGVRLRLDWENAARFAGVALTPYTDLSYVQTKIDAYTESGGSFPARFNSRSEDSTEFHLGVDGTYPLSSSTTLFARAEYAHRFEKDTAGTSGTVVGLFDFSFPGLPTEQDWLRLGVGADMKLGPGVLSAMLNGTTKGSAPSYWLNVSYQVPF